MASRIAANDEIIPNQYIVVFKRHTPDDQYQSHCAWATDLQSPGAMSARGVDYSGYEGIQHRYDIKCEGGGLLGYAGSFHPNAAAEIFSREEVAYVEADRKVYTKTIVSEKTDCWGLTRLSHASPAASLTGDKEYRYDDSAGDGVTAYVIDTGVFTEHDDFEGRAVLGHNAVPGSSNTDKNGHGTHVSGTIAGKEYGVAKKAKIIGVKVLGDNGTGSNSTVIAGLNWAVEDAQSKGLLKSGKSVANMSLGGSFSRAMNSAVAAVIELNMTVCVAAGNERQNASNSSPASEPSAITVGATTIKDEMADFSNWGPLVNIFGPGSDITSAWIDTTNQKRTNLSNTISGTSMATPHIAGLCAYLISLHKLETVDEVTAMLTKLGQRNLITNLQGNSPNILANNGFTGSSDEL